MAEQKLFSYLRQQIKKHGEATQLSPQGAIAVDYFIKHMNLKDIKGNKIPNNGLADAFYERNYLRTFSILGKMTNKLYKEENKCKLLKTYNEHGLCVEYFTCPILENTEIGMMKINGIIAILAEELSLKLGKN